MGPSQQKGSYGLTLDYSPLSRLSSTRTPIIMTEMQIEKTLEEKRKEIENDISSLSRVSHRLAMLDTTEKLSQVLDKLLPRLLLRIGENHKRQLIETSLHEPLSRTHAKLVEMLSHTMKRVREDKQCQLPCRGILDLLVEESQPGSIVANVKVDPFTLNLSLAFLTLGINRCPNWENLLPGLLVLHGYFSSLSADKLVQSPSTKSQWHQVTHLLFRAMDNIMKVEEENSKVNLSPFMNASGGKRLKSSVSTDPVDNSKDDKIDDPLTTIRSLLANDEVTASACYNLLLDIILYQTTPANSNVPPPGLSQSGHLRLISGASETARDWAAEMAPRSQLVQIKSRILDWIAPSRRWGLFTANTRGKTRSMALLIIAAGDPTPEVSQKASTFLKQALDPQRDDFNAYGEPSSLIQELLILSVGASNAQLVLSRESPETDLLLTLGTSRASGEHLNQQAILSLKRRMVAESTIATIMDYAAKILVDSPASFDGDGVGRTRMGGLANLVLLACHKNLSQLRTSSGLTMLRGKTFIAAAQLLNALMVRLTARKTSEPVDPVVLAKAMAIGCDCLSTVVASKISVPSSSFTTTIGGSEGNIAVREALYGVVCTLSRSNLSPEKMLWLFAKGEHSSTSISVETATLLFGCIAAEDDVLRPRAVAALDALLAAYCRLNVYNDDKLSNSNNAAPLEATTVNPWGQMADSAPKNKITERSDSTTHMLKSELSCLLLPVLWAASQHSQPSQSRVAAARWAYDLLSKLDLTSACHILCFLAGDSDVTASTSAREALSTVQVSKAEERLPTGMVADFSEMVAVLFTDTSAQAMNTWRPSFWEFTHKGRTAAVEYLIRCLLHDMYGGDEEAIRVFVLALSTSILDASSHSNRDSLGLLDECAGALSLCMSTSLYARSLISSGSGPLTAPKIQELSVHCNSSKARRLLAETWGNLYQDVLLYDDHVCANQLETALQFCCGIIEQKSSIGQRHGAAFLGGTCIKVYRQRTTLNASEIMTTLASKYVPLVAFLYS